MKSSILAVGTELTTGQIINRNASTLSEKLKGFGVETALHLTIPDDRKLILESLEYVASQSDLIFVTGGLGPTSDDFTRDVVADWLKKPLLYDEKAWQHIVDRLTPRGFQVREMQKQQCYFPEGAEILKNREGTAHAFRAPIERAGQAAQNIFVLPGPPREIDSVWQDHIAPWLALATKNIEKRTTKAWDTMGVGESEVAYLVEDILKKFPKPKQLEIGYRVHLPYVEVKVTYAENQKAIFHETLLQIDQALRYITITRNFEDVATQVGRGLEKVEFTFYDYISDGYLLGRLSASLKSLPNWNFKQSTRKEITADFFEGEDNFLALLPHDEQSSLVLFTIDGQAHLKTVEAPMKSSLMTERRKQYFAEMALVHLAKELKPYLPN